MLDSVSFWSGGEGAVFGSAASKLATVGYMVSPPSTVYVNALPCKVIVW